MPSLLQFYFSFTPPVTEPTSCSDALEHCQYHQKPIPARPLSPGAWCHEYSRSGARRASTWRTWAEFTRACAAPRIEHIPALGGERVPGTELFQQLLHVGVNILHLNVPIRPRPFPFLLRKGLQCSVVAIPHPAHCSTGASPWLMENPGTSKVNQLPKLPNLSLCAGDTENQRGCPCSRSRAVHHKSLLLLCSKGQEVQYFLF